MTIRETTVPAAADSGMRTFEANDQDHRIEVAVTLSENTALFDEELTLTITGNVPTNDQLARALLAMAYQLFNTPGQSLPSA